MKKIIGLFSSLTLGAVLLFATSASAAHTLFGEASILLSGGNPGGALQTVSDASPGFGGASFDDANGTTFSSLATLSTDYNVTDDDCGGGSPRFQVSVDTDNDGTSNGSVKIALGPSPSFTNCPAGWQSTGNLIGNNDAGRYDFSAFGGSPFTTYSNAPAAVLSGTIKNISLVIDSSWSNDATNGDGEQTVLFDNITINSAVYPFTFQPTGGITNPANNGDHVSGVVNFTATYNDGEAVNDDAVQWAIRSGTCAATTGTVFGNVDGHSDPSSWDGAAFSSTLDTSGLPTGPYCFVFNPTDDAGQNDVRETRDFIIDAVAPVIPTQCEGMTFDRTITGTSGNDTLNGSGGRDLIFGLGGDDKINGASGNDCLVGGEGNDDIKGASGNDVIVAGEGNDKAQGASGNDDLFGEGGNDELKGEAGNDDIDGGTGNDELDGSSGSDRLIGGADTDTAKGSSGSDTCDAETETSCEANP